MASGKGKGPDAHCHQMWPLGQTKSVTTGWCSVSRNTRTIKRTGTVGGLGWLPVWFPLPVTVSLKVPLWTLDSALTFEVSELQRSA